MLSKITPVFKGMVGSEVFGPPGNTIDLVISPETLQVALTSNRVPGAASIV
jgi:hypothetical protein